MNIRSTAIGTCALVLAFAMGCSSEKVQARDSEVIVHDVGAPSPGDPLMGVDIPQDSVTATSPIAPLPLPPPTTDRAADTVLVIATPKELRELAGALAIPVQGVRAADLHDTFDERRGGGTRGHEALDILAPRGTPVLAATDGRLLKLFSSVAGGLMVYAGDASDRFVLMYGHLDRYAGGLREGQALSRGDVIGYVGTTGNAPAGTPHLHFAIARGHPSVKWWRGTPVNPYPLLREGAPPVP